MLYNFCQLLNFSIDLFLVLYLRYRRGQASNHGKHSWIFRFCQAFFPQVHKVASLTARIFSTFKLFEVQHEGKEICQDLFFFFFFEVITKKGRKWSRKTSFLGCRVRSSYAAVSWQSKPEVLSDQAIPGHPIEIYYSGTSIQGRAKWLVKRFLFIKGSTEVFNTDLLSDKDNKAVRKRADLIKLKGTVQACVIELHSSSDSKVEFKS